MTRMKRKRRLPMREVLEYLESSHQQKTYRVTQIEILERKMRETLERWRDIANHIDQLTAIKKLRQEIEEVLQ
jgi:hypothetical protein